jgi:hypothetical protein
VRRFVDRGAISAAWVGVGVAVTLALSFLLIIPIEPIYWLLALPAGLLIGYYANARADRRAGPWSRILANGAFAGAVTGLALAAVLLGIKALFFYADNGYRDSSAGGNLVCQTGANCAWARYDADRGDALRAAGITDAATFQRYYWDQQLATAGILVVLTAAGGLAGAVAYGLVRPKGIQGATTAAAEPGRAEPGSATSPRSSSPPSAG